MNCMSESCLVFGLYSRIPSDFCYRQLKAKYPSNPLALDLKEKEALFDELIAKFEVPARAVLAQA